MSYGDFRMTNNMPHFFLILIISILSLPGISFAGVYNYQEVLIGEKAAGMGGAFTALADDATATYYNPAGIIQIPFNSMSASANVITYKIRNGKFFLKDNEKLRSFDFIPTFWGVTATTFLGNVGFSIVVPESDNFELHELYSNEHLLGYDWNTARADRIFESKTYLLGPSYSFNVNKSLSAGFSLYFLYNNFTENVYNYWDTEYTDSSDSKAYTLLLENSRSLNGSGTGVTGKFGVLYRIGDKFRIGLSLKPTAEISEEVKVRQVVYMSNISNDSPVTVKAFSRGNAEGTVSYTRKLPYSSTLGMAYFPSERLTIALDLSYYGPVNYAEVTKALDDNLKSVDASRKVILNELLNGNLGMEYMITPKIPLRAGIFTDLSSAPKVEDIHAAQATHIDKYGLTLSSGSISANSTVIAGIRYGFGHGYGTASSYSKDNIEYTIRKEEYTQGDLALFISGTYMF
ncbi:MAG: outer membrane protein transport protein [Nitrospirae bacterium]|nr:outer membrane protein transport protein [Nitrospirota bacterium]